MDLNGLTPDEDVVLLGLLREIVQADGSVTDAERQEIAMLRAKLGASRFDHAVTEAQKRYSTLDALKADAKRVTRSEARAAIFSFLEEVAASDDISTNEEKPLRWLSSWWHVGRKTPK